MKKPLQIGITGGIGSGKSLVCRVFQCLGVPVYDADSRAKSVMTSDGIVVSGIKKEFGSLAYHASGGINREFLAKVVFSDPVKLQKLNEWVHPAVRNDYRKWLSEQHGSHYILKEAALLFEAGSDSDLDKVLVVQAPEELRIKRVIQRDAHRDEKQVKEIIRNQMSDVEKRKRADFVIQNDGSALVVPQVLELHRQFLMLN